MKCNSISGFKRNEIELFEMIGAKLTNRNANDLNNVRMFICRDGITKLSQQFI